MNPADIRKLLGGYAAGTLTAEERQALFEAALTDQDLFNELAREQALKDLLEDPGARRQLLAALEEEPAFVDRLRAWMGRPVAWVAAGSLAAVALLVVVAVRRVEPPLASEPVITAKLEAPALPDAPVATREPAKDREKAAIAPMATPAAPPAPARKATPEAPSEIAKGQGMRADVVVQPPGPAEVQLEVASKDDFVRGSNLRDAGPGGVVGGTAGAAGGSVRSEVSAGVRPPAAAPQPVIVQAETVLISPDAADSNLRALEASRSRARAAFATSAVGIADAGADKRSNAAIVPPPIPYRILRAGVDGRFAEVPAGTAFRVADRVRVVFSPPGPGRLVATTANRPRPLLDRAVRQGATVDLNLPAGVSSVQVTFTAQPAAPAPVTFFIAIPREPAP